MLRFADRSLTRMAAMAIMALISVTQLAACRQGSTDYGYPVWYGLYEKVCDLEPIPGCTYAINSTNVFKFVSRDGSDTYLPIEIRVRDFYDRGWRNTVLFSERVPVFFFYRFVYSDGTRPGEMIDWGWVHPDSLEVFTPYGSISLNESPSWAIDRVEFARLESNVVKAAGVAFAKEYVLSEETGVRLAKAANEWARIGWTQARTTDDHDRFAKIAFGLEMKIVENALVKAKAGDLAAMDPVIERVSSHLGASQKITRDILRNWYTDGAAVIF